MAAEAWLNCLLSEENLYGQWYVGDWHVSALRSLEVSSPQRFQTYWFNAKFNRGQENCLLQGGLLRKCNGNSIRGNRTICSRGSVRTTEGLFIEVLLYMYTSDRSQNKLC